MRLKLKPIVTIYLAVVLLAAPSALAQVDNYLGPGILSRGANRIGTGGGSEQLDMRFFASVAGFYDNGIQPVSVDSNGKLVQSKGLTGEETTLGVVGTHRFRHAELGLNYQGNYRQYNGNSYYNTSDHQLVLGYSLQTSRRVEIDMRQMAGSISRVIGSNSLTNSTLGTFTDSLSNSVATPTSLLFDNRTQYLQSSVDVNFLKTSRTIFAAGGDGFWTRRQSSTLVGAQGYNLRGQVNHRFSRTTTAGAGFQHTHYDFGRSFGETDIDTYQLFIAKNVGRTWVVLVRGGAFHAQVQSLRNVALDPAIAALVGINTTVTTSYRDNWLPYGDFSLERRGRYSNVYFNYSRTQTPGNGVFLASRSEAETAGIRYNRLRRFNFDLFAGYHSLRALGQELGNYQQLNAGTGMNYMIMPSLYFNARYDARQQQIDNAGYSRTGYRVSIGLTYTPGEIPVSLW